jgi:protein-L-isoaspartate O-methyltransferase
MAKALSDTGGELITIEWDKDLAKGARVNIEKAGLPCGVKVIPGDAKNLLSEFEPGHFDMIFQDVEKEMYLELLDQCATGDFLSTSLEHPDLDGFHIWAFLPGHGPEYDGLTFLIKK